MENLKELGMNGMLVDLKEFRSDKQETVKRWISRENYSQFKMELEQYEDRETIDIWLHNNFYYGMSKEDIGVLTESLVQAGGFVEQGEDLKYNFWLDSRLIYTIDLDLI